MRALAIIGRDHAAAAQARVIEVEGVAVRAAILSVAEPRFDPVAQPDSVLLRVLGFSMNFRDRALALRMAVSPRTDGFYVVGSDFVAEVLTVGQAIDDLVPGDHVIPDCPWPAGTAGSPGGIPTNHASRELQVLRRAALMRVPAAMDLAVAACFSIGSQTAQSMVRRIRPAAGERVLLTAPRSNTALFVLGVLAGTGAVVHGVSSSGRDADRLRMLGIETLIVANAREDSLADHPGFAAVLAEGGYDAVVDPFADLYLPQVVPLMAVGGRYITCGIEDQSSHLTGVQRPPAPHQQIIVQMMAKNLCLMGNCLGSSDDLRRALDAYVAGHFTVQIDRVFRDDAPGFLERTYVAADRFGKVAFRYV